MKRDIFFIITISIILTIGIPIFNPGKGQGDFLGYWSATRLFSSGGNPFNQDEMTLLQDEVSPERYSNNNVTVIAWNPPWLILILLPIGLLPYNIAILVWIFINTFLIGLALIITWKLCANEDRSRGILVVYIAGFLFVETISYLGSGQITGLVLLGIVLTILFINSGQDIMAGITLLMTTIKPHISYLFILLIMIWLLQNHRWKIIVGFVSAALVSMIIFWFFIPNWLSDYIYLIKNLPFNLLFTSTLGSFASAMIGSSIFKYSAVLLLFLIKPLLTLAKAEGWLTSTNIVLMSSLPLSPFGFNFDQIILLPAIVQIIYWVSKRYLSIKSMLSIGIGLVAINFVVLKMLMENGLEQFWFFWIPLAILVIYLFAWKAKDVPR